MLLCCLISLRGAGLNEHAGSTCLVQVDDLRKQLIEATRLSIGALLSWLLWAMACAGE